MLSFLILCAEDTPECTLLHLKVQKFSGGNPRTPLAGWGAPFRTHSQHAFGARANVSPGQVYLRVGNSNK